jgi:signal transduction histidine kinase
MAAEPSRWARLRASVGTVRVRTTAAAVVVVGVALLVGAVGLVVTLRRSLTNDVRTAGELRAMDVAGVLEGGTPPASLAVNDEEDLFIQIINSRDRVVAASPSVEGQPPVADIDAGQSGRVGGLPIDEGDDEFLVVAVKAVTPDGRLTVLVGRELESVEESVGFVTSVLAAGVPILLAIVGATTWAVVGRALRPVEAIREEVHEISAAELHRRVPDPPGSDEIARLARTMNSMLDRLEDSQRRQRRFVSDASHELQSPVATIRQHAEVAIAHPEGSSVPELAGDVLAEDVRLQRLVEDLLLLTRADERTLGRTRKPVDVDDLVFEEARRLRDAARISVDTTGVSVGRVDGDAAQLGRVVRNLADNAARHAASRVVFELRQRDGAVVLRVDDDGPGVPVDERQRIFARFTRLDDARTRNTGGSGLGLAIVAEIVAAHGGAVTVADAPAGGARFEVRLPAGRE